MHSWRSASNPIETRRAATEDCSSCMSDWWQTRAEEEEILSPVLGYHRRYTDCFQFSSVLAVSRRIDLVSLVLGVLLARFAWLAKLKPSSRLFESRDRCSCVYWTHFSDDVDSTQQKCRVMVGSWEKISGDEKDERMPHDCTVKVNLRLCWIN